MRQFLFASVAALTLTVGTMAAQAVDVVNSDEESHELMVEIDGNAQVIEVLPGNTMTDVCGRCILSMEDGDSVEAEGDLVAVIKGGKIELKSKVN